LVFPPEEEYRQALGFHGAPFRVDTENRHKPAGDLKILCANGKLGTLRVKPGGLLWKPKRQQKFYSVSLEQFEAWITNSATGAKRTGS
jgi:hypothetical protein